MSQSSLESQFKDAGIPSSAASKVVAPIRTGTGTSRTRSSDLWLYRWAKNSYRNYELVSRAKGVKLLIDACAGAPAFVVGVGPSLDASLPALREAQGKA
jgi:hypothetical protein